MSVHIFDTEDREGMPVQIRMGWDRPLQRSFMTVEWLSERDEEDERPQMLNVYNKTGLISLGKKLLEFGISVPSEMFEEVAVDERFNAGNRIVRHNVVDGKYRKEVLNEV